MEGTPSGDRWRVGAFENLRELGHGDGVASSFIDALAKVLEPHHERMRTRLCVRREMRAVWRYERAHDDVGDTGVAETLIE